MNVCKRIMKGAKMNVVFIPSISIDRNDRFGIATEYNTKRKLQDYFFVDLATNAAHLITTRTYDRLVAQSDPVI